MDAMNDKRRSGKRYTYADYCTWDDEERWELIDGVPYAMSPAPTTTHQLILGELFAQLHNFLHRKPCKVFTAPYDVRLNADKGDDTVVQPDIIVVCDRSKIDERGCKGAPDLVIEILSPSSSKRDRIIKFNKYLEAGVREYWLVDPVNSSVIVHFFQGKKLSTNYSHDAKIHVGVLPGCIVDLGFVFEQMEEKL